MQLSTSGACKHQVTCSRRNSLPDVNIKWRNHGAGATQQIKPAHEVEHTVYILLMPPLGLCNLHSKQVGSWILPGYPILWGM